MKPRLILIMIALVVIPTAILSLLAAGAVRIREQDLERRLKSAAEQAVESAIQSFRSDLAAVHEEAITEASGLLAEGKPDGLLSAAERLRRSYSIVDQVYVIKPPREFIYPAATTGAYNVKPVAAVSDRGAALTEGGHSTKPVDVASKADPILARLRRIQDLHHKGNAYEAAAKEYQRILDFPGVAPAVRAEAGIGAAQCYRKLGKFEFAAGLLRQFAGYYSSGALALRRLTLDPRLAVHDSGGYMYSLTALKELIEVFREAEKREKEKDKQRWRRRAIESELELLDRVVFLYDHIVLEQRQSLLSRLTEDHESTNIQSSDQQTRHRAARLMALLRERQWNEKFSSEERGSLALAVEDKIKREGAPRDLAWLTVNDAVYSCSLLPRIDNTFCGFRMNTEALSSYVSNSVQRIGERHGVAIVLSHEGSVFSVQGSGNRQPTTEVGRPIRNQRDTNNESRITNNERPLGKADAALASATLPWPFDSITLRAYAADPVALRRGKVLRVGLQQWGVLVLALGVIGGALVVLGKASGEVRRARARSDFVAGVSHDLRTPLSSMRMLAESLYLGRVKDPNKQKKFLNTILRESQRLGNLAERVLFFVRLGDDALRYQRKRTNVGELVREAVEGFATALPAAKPDHGPEEPAISVEVEEGLPEIEVDQAAITQVVMNLLDNAVKYSGGTGDRRQESGVRGQESVSDNQEPIRQAQGKPGTKNQEPIAVKVGRRGEDEIEISVRDEGRGMDPSELKKIFRKFYRAAGGESDTTPGVGLGLALCRQIVRAHRGRIEVESELGKGSTFRVILPL